MPQVFENYMVLQNVVADNQDYNPYTYDFTNMSNMGTLSPSNSSIDSQGTSSVASPMSVSSSPHHMHNFITLNNVTVVGVPQIRILDQPVEKFRFRYKSEMMGTHGSLVGASSATSRKKQAPTVELLNYPGRAVIRCTLVTSTPERRMPHAHHLVRREDNMDRDDPHEIVVSTENGFIASFQGMGIIHTAKKHIKDELVRKTRIEALEKAKQKNVNITSLSVREETQIKMDAEAAQKWMNLNSVALCFQGFVVDADGVLTPITEPVYSNPINNLKSALTGELKICRIDKFTSSCDGGEEVFILVEKVGKKNIKIKFFELNEDDQEIWCDYGRFSELDVHHQYAIVFRTPSYRDRDITSPKEVFIQLERPTDGDCSEPIKFTYKPSDKMMNRKRPRVSYSGNMDFIPQLSPLLDSSPTMDCSLELSNESRNISKELEDLMSERCSSNEFKEFFEKIDVQQYLDLMDNRSKEDMLTTDGSSSKEDDSNFAVNVVSEAVKALKKEPSKLKERLLALLKERTVYGDSPLHSALRHGQRDIAKYILMLLGSDPDYKPFVNVQNSSGKTPLHYAVLQNQPEVTKALLMLGADPNTCDDHGFSPLHTAVKIPEAGACVDALLSAKINTEVRDDAGWTALHLAAEAGSINAVHLLVKAGADVNNTDMSYGRTALHIAVEGGHKSIVEFLLKETNIDVNKRNFSGNTALHSAVVNTGSRANELCKLLIHYGANPSIANHNRESAKKEDPKDVSIKQEVDSEDEDRDEENGQTSFDLASNNPEILRLLTGNEEKKEQLEPTAAVEVKKETIEEDESGSSWLDTGKISVLASILDKSRGWEKLAKRLEYGFLLNTLEKSPTSPSLTLLNYADIQGDITVEKLRELLIELGETKAVVTIDELISEQQ